MDASVRFASVNDFNQWSERYFRNPTPEHVPAALAFCEKKGLLNEVNFAQLSHSDTSAVFKIAQIFRCHPEKVWEWAKACRAFKESSQKGVMQALWLPQNAEGKQVLKKFAESTLKTADYAAVLLANPLIVSDVGDPVSFHLLWSGYYATGDLRYIGSLIDAIPLMNQNGLQKVTTIGVSLIREARLDAGLATFIVQHCRAHAASATDQDLKHLINTFAPKPRQNYTADQLFPAQPNLEAEVKAKAAIVTNIVFGMRQNATLPQAQAYAQDQYRQLTENCSNETISQMIFKLEALDGLDDQGLSEIARCYGYCIRKKKSTMGCTDIWCERIPPN